jgi:hypothetical protein
MEIARVDLRRLRLNPHNDRHGALKDETASIQWLLENKKNHMRTLSQDLAKTKRLYERPLIRPEGEQFIVFDGNRRTCCIKLLTDPSLAPIEEWLHFFSELHSEEITSAFSTIECEVESDLEIIDETLLRRHTGSQDGVGQSPWDPQGKSFFLQRTGKADIGLGESIERALKTEQLITPETSLPWSNLERLFSSEPIRKRAGISFSGNVLTYLQDKQRNLQTLKKIADDLVGAESARKIVLEDLWNNAKKGQYLDRLKSEGFFIDAATPTSALAAAATSQVATSPTQVVRGKKPRKEKHLIIGTDYNPFMQVPELERAQNIWRELQFELEFDRHDNAIAVLMRVLLELSIVFYARKQGIIFGQAEPFASRVSRVADSMLNRDFFDAKARSIMRKFETDKAIVSAHSMHQYVHGSDFHPARTDLKAIWNVIRPIIIYSVR